MERQFLNDLERGQMYEKDIARWLKSKGYSIFHVPAHHQRGNLKFDLLVKNKEGNYFCVEIKTEPMAERTGNLYFEFEVNGKDGYIRKYSRFSNIIMLYFLPASRRVIIFPARLFNYLKTDTLQVRACKLNSYSATGYLVPIKQLLKSEKVTCLKI
jgi:hypothetical protein